MAERDAQDVKFGDLIGDNGYMPGAIIDIHPFHDIDPFQTRQDRNWHRDGVTRKRAVNLARRHPQASFDLHGYRIEEAFKELEAFVANALQRGLEVIEVVHGKGSGKMRGACRGWLSSCMWVLAYSETAHNSGSILVLLKTDGR